MKAVELLIEMLNCIGRTGSLEDGTAMLDILDCRNPSSELMQLLDRRLEDSGTPLSHLEVIYLSKTTIFDPPLTTDIDPPG